MADIMDPVMEMMPAPPAPEDEAPVETEPEPRTLPEEHPCGGEPSYVGPAPVRLMTRLEYNNTVAVLLDDDTEPASAFPVETETLGFENGEAHTANPLLVERYMTVAEEVAQRAVDTLGLPALLPCQPAVEGDIACGETFIQEFGTRAFRRPLTFEEFSVFQELLLTALPKWGLNEAVQLVIQAMLQSPQFLYRVELGVPSEAASADVMPLSSWEMASRLSYFLWGSMPDDELLAAAEADELRSPAQIEAQARRMLADDRARDMVWDFHRQWLDLDRLDGLTKDQEANPDYDPALKAYWKSELRYFIDRAVWSEDGGLEALLTSTTSFVNQDLADLYGIAPPEDNEGFSEVELPADERAGLLTQPGLMALLSLPDQSSPIFRGIFVREELLCQPLSPPPPDIVIVPPDPDPNATTRERFAQHTEDPVCQDCHVLIDPIGFGFEQYDATGRFRAEENGLPVDASGELGYTGEIGIEGEFDGAVELADKLAASSTVRDCVATHWFRYSFGRKEQEGDEACNLGYPLTRFAESGGDYQELILALTQTYAFRYRQAEDEVTP